jgi:protein-tyrosine kinase
MSEFFKALQRAEQERALREQATPELVELHPVATTEEDPTTPEAGAMATEAAAIATEAPVTPAPAVAATTPGHAATTQARAATTEALEEIIAPRSPRLHTEGIDGHLVSLLSPASTEADRYRVLRDAVEQRRGNRSSVVLAVTSAGAGEGKTTTAINLAGTLAQDAKARVLIIDADVRNPSVAGCLALDNSEGRGLTDALLNPSLPLERAVLRLPGFNLTILDSGQSSATPYELLRLPRLGELLQEARQQYDSIILDVPPAIPFPDCRVISRWIDGFLFVVTAHKTPRKFFEEALKSIEPSLLAALVFNGDDSPLETTYYSRAHARNGHAPAWQRAVRRSAGRVYAQWR